MSDLLLFVIETNYISGQPIILPGITCGTRIEMKTVMKCQRQIEDRDNILEEDSIENEKSKS